MRLDPVTIWWDGQRLTYPCPACRLETELATAVAHTQIVNCPSCDTTLELPPPNPQIQKYMKKRIHFIDERQDLLCLDVEVDDGGIGSVVGVAGSCGRTLRAVYVGHAVDLSDCHPGYPLPLADPYDDFRVWNTRYVVDRVEELAEEHSPAWRKGYATAMGIAKNY